MINFEVPRCNICEIYGKKQIRMEERSEKNICKLILNISSRKV